MEALERELLALQKGGDGMLKDITLGQYFPGDTVAHRLDPRTKILLVVLYIVALFLRQEPAGLRHSGGWCWQSVSASPESGSNALVRGLKPVVFIIDLHRRSEPVLHAGGSTSWSELGLHPDHRRRALQNAVFMVLRIMLLIIGHLPADLHHLAPSASPTGWSGC